MGALECSKLVRGEGAPRRPQRPAAGSLSNLLLASRSAVLYVPRKGSVLTGTGLPVGGHTPGWLHQLLKW